jgi:hypothetical protein
MSLTLLKYKFLIGFYREKTFFSVNQMLTPLVFETNLDIFQLQIYVQHRNI